MDNFFSKTYNLIESIKQTTSINQIEELEDLWKEKAEVEEFVKINILLKNPKENQLIHHCLIHHFLENDEELALLYYSEISPFISRKETYLLSQLINNHRRVKRIKKEIQENKFSEIDSFIMQNSFFKDNLCLEFETKKLKCLNKIKQSAKNAIQFMREEMGKFIQHPLFRDNLRSFLLLLVNKSEVNIIDNVFEILDKNVYQVFGIPITPFLNKLYIAGREAIPVLKEATYIYSDAQVNNFIDKETLVRLPIAEDFHSVFVCPVMKNACDSSNLPCLLDCGHVISQNAIAQITKSGSKSSFKCPYCPVECTFAKCKILFLRT